MKLTAADFVRGIAPTHTCFDDALDYLEALAKEGAGARALSRYTVVHAICLAPDDTPFVHAWLEHAGMAVQGGIVVGQRIFYEMPIADFREHFKVVEETRYTVRQALAENVRAGHYGPWVEKYRALVNDDGEHLVWDSGQSLRFVIEHDPSGSPNHEHERED